MFEYFYFVLVCVCKTPGFVQRPVNTGTRCHRRDVDVYNPRLKKVMSEHCSIGTKIFLDKSTNNIRKNYRIQGGVIKHYFF